MDADAPGLAVQPNQEDVQRIIEKIRKADPKWRLGKAIDLGGTRWQPHLVKAKRALHVHVADRMRPYLISRLRAAASIGRIPVVALPVERLWDGDLTQQLLNVGAELLVLGPGDQFNVRTSLVLSALGEHEVRPRVEVRQALSRAGWAAAQALAPTSAVKGQRLEAVLSFLLAQIQDFRIVERNFRTATEELDIVVQHRGTERCWAKIGCPYILVECKNWNEKVDQTAFSAFRTKIQGKRGTVRIGLMVSSMGFTEDAYAQELRFAAEDITIVFLGPEEVDKWIEASAFDDFLEGIVRRAMLR